MNLLVTGATGFVGSHFLDALSGRPGDVTVLVRSTSDLTHLDNPAWSGGPLHIRRITGSLEDEEALGEAVEGAEAVVHLAALTRAKNEAEFRKANEDGTRKLLRAAKDSDTCRRFIYLSSLAAAGPAEPGKPVEPEDDPRPLTAYGRSKLAGEAACREVAEEIETIILRPPAVYGPRDHDLLSFFKLANAGVLPVPLGPARFLQLIHVQDLVVAIRQSISAQKATGVYHVAEDAAYSWSNVLALMSEAVGKRGRRIPIPQMVFQLAGALSGGLGRVVGKPQIFDRDKARELLAPGWLCEVERARSDLGFSASIPLEKGLRSTAAWYREKGWLR